MKAWQFLAVVALIAFPAIEGGLLLRDADRKIKAVDVVALNQTIQHLDAVTAKVSAAADEQTTYWATEQRETTKVIAGLKEVIVRTDCSLNGGPGCVGALPQLSATLAQIQSATAETSTNLNTSLVTANKQLEQLQPILADMQATSDALAKQTPAILSNTADTSVQLKQVAQNANAVTQDSKKIADHYTQIILHPAHSIWHALKSVGDFFVEGLEAHAYWP